MIGNIYKVLSERSAPALKFYLNRRIKSGKEDPQRIKERFGITAIPRPEGKLIWIHAASVGEAQAALILINSINDTVATHHSFLITTGTRTSAKLMADRLPTNATHQYTPLDHPDWVHKFMDHWSPDIALWMESELWPNTLTLLKKNKVPTALINARMSKSSFRNWHRAKATARSILSTFDTILCQTDEHKYFFDQLGASNVLVTDNLKYSAQPLPYDPHTLKDLQTATKDRPLWLYASTHSGEESLACATHVTLKKKHPNLLTIIVPRHPERRNEISKECSTSNLSIELRSTTQTPAPTTDIYVADTLGELGLFYKLSEIAVIGRSFSDDGGGGHNPIEASLLDCAVLTGPNHQNQAELFDAMLEAKAAKIVPSKQDLASYIENLFNNHASRKDLIEAGQKFASRKSGVINYVIDEIEPLFLKADISYT